jgi:hypothetical protein
MSAGDSPARRVREEGECTSSGLNFELVRLRLPSARFSPGEARAGRGGPGAVCAIIGTVYNTHRRRHRTPAPSGRSWPSKNYFARKPRVAFRDSLHPPWRSAATHGRARRIACLPWKMILNQSRRLGRTTIGFHAFAYPFGIFSKGRRRENPEHFIANLFS